MPDDPLPIPGDAVPSWRRRLLDMLEFRPREAFALGIVCLAIVAGAAFAYARSLPRDAPAANSAASPLTAPSPETSGSPSGALVVHVAGAVRNPGVYRLPPGARVVDGLTAAGGPAAGADIAQINLARQLNDGERIYIPRRGETPPADAGVTGGSGGGETAGKLNLNTATVSQLEDLPGVGEVLAQRIFDYRAQHGPFRTVRDLLKVEGIGEKKFESIKDHVTV